MDVTKSSADIHGINEVKKTYIPEKINPKIGLNKIIIYYIFKIDGFL